MWNNDYQGLPTVTDRRTNTPQAARIAQEHTARASDRHISCMLHVTVKHTSNSFTCINFLTFGDTNTCNAQFVFNVSGINGIDHIFGVYEEDIQIQ